MLVSQIRTGGSDSRHHEPRPVRKYRSHRAEFPPRSHYGLDSGGHGQSRQPRDLPLQVHRIPSGRLSVALGRVRGQHRHRGESHRAPGVHGCLEHLPAPGRVHGGKIHPQIPRGADGSGNRAGDVVPFEVQEHRDTAVLQPANDRRPVPEK